MSGFSVFLNNRITPEFTFGGIHVALGDWFLTPVRCLFNGNVVTITTEKDAAVTVRHAREFNRNNIFGPQKTFLLVIASIVLLIPGIFLGTIIKGLGYLAPSIRENHRLTILHYTPIDCTIIGSDSNRLDESRLREALKKEQENNHLNRSSNTLIVYAAPGTTLNIDPGLLNLKPEKIILIGATIVHKPCSVTRLDDKLANTGWDNRGIRQVRNASESDSSTFVTQFKMESLKDALNDVPPKESFFSSEHVKRVYVI